MALTNINFNSNSSPNGYTEGPSYSFFEAPTVRANGQGVRRMWYTTAFIHLAGRGANRSAAIYLADSGGGGLKSTGVMTIPSGSSSQKVGDWVDKLSIGDGRTMRVGYYLTSSGLFNFGAAAGAGTVYNGFGNFTDRALTGHAFYAVCPSAPTMRDPELLPGGAVTIRFDSGPDDSGAAVTRWVIEYDTVSNFASPNRVNSSGTTTFQLEPGVQYWFRAAGVNAVVDPYGETGVWSNVKSAVMLSGGKILVGGVWVNAEPKIRDAGTWKSAKVKIREGGTWKAAV